jgi:hypothetical protein
MSTTYTFNVRNLEQSPATMWLFLDTPVIPSQNLSKIFQNSDTSLEVPHYNGHGQQVFKATVQYQLDVGQQTQPVALGNQIISKDTIDASLDTGYLAHYSGKKGGFPSLTAGSTSNPPAATNMVVQTNPFVPVQHYHNSLTFGLRTEQGTTGVTWEPLPNFDYTITPTLTFYIAVGNYVSNVLAQVGGSGATNAALKTGPGGSFNQFNNTWVTYTTTGQWEVQSQEWTD